MLQLPMQFFDKIYQKNASYFIPFVPASRLSPIFNRIISVLFIVHDYYSIFLIDLISLPMYSRFDFL